MQAEDLFKEDVKWPTDIQKDTQNHPGNEIKAQ